MSNIACQTKYADDGTYLYQWEKDSERWVSLQEMMDLTGAFKRAIKGRLQYNRRWPKDVVEMGAQQREKLWFWNGNDLFPVGRYSTVKLAEIRDMQVPAMRHRLKTHGADIAMSMTMGELQKLKTKRKKTSKTRHHKKLGKWAGRYNKAKAEAILASIPGPTPYEIQYGL